MGQKTGYPVLKRIQDTSVKRLDYVLAPDSGIAAFASSFSHRVAQSRASEFVCQRLIALLPQLFEVR